MSTNTKEQTLQDIGRSPACAITSKQLTGRQLGALIRKTKGPIYVDFHTPHDAMRVQAVKADLIRVLDHDYPAHLSLETDTSGSNFLAAVDGWAS